MINSEISNKDQDINQNLIFDIGVNKGEDTRFYLDKGFNVVGVEASPVIVEQLKIDFAQELASGRFILEECGLWHERCQITFYRNLDNDHWSSFEEAYGCRNGTAYEELVIDCITTKDLVEKHGMPRFMKIDVEGADKYIVADLAGFNLKPLFVSVEEYGKDAIEALHNAGYTKFNFTAQRDKKWAIPPNPPKEGAFIEKTFTGYDSGLFGLELPSEWLDYEAAKAEFRNNIRNDEYVYVGPENEWYDVHAMRAA